MKHLMNSKKQLIQLDSNDPSLYEVLGDILRQQGKQQEAREALEKAKKFFEAEGNTAKVNQINQSIGEIMMGQAANVAVAAANVAVETAKGFFNRFFG